MLEFQNKRIVTVVAGLAGTGKTTFVLRFTANTHKDHSVIFIYDPEGEYSARLNVPAAETLLDLQAALVNGFVVFDPNTLFGGDHEAGFAFFCEWVFAMCAKVPGRKLLLVDEAWRYTSSRKQPKELEDCVRAGRKRGLATMFATQTPNLLHSTIRNECSELVCFRLQEETVLDWPASRGFNPEELKALPDLQFVARNLDTGGELRHRIKL